MRKIRKSSVVARLARLGLMLLAAGSCGTLIVACGQKGPLVLPKSPAASAPSR